MGINDTSDIVADLAIAPTSAGMVRLFVATDSIEIPMDFTPEEASEIAAEIQAAAIAAQQQAPQKQVKK